MASRTSTPLRIFVSGPRRNDEDLERISSVVTAIWGCGHYPVITAPPIAPLSDDAAFAWDYSAALLRVCDGVMFATNWELSERCKVEAFIAKTLGIPIYEHFEDLPLVVRDQKKMAEIEHLEWKHGHQRRQAQTKPSSDCCMLPLEAICRILHDLDLVGGANG